MANELKITLTVDERGSVKLSQVKKDLDSLEGSAKKAGRGLAESGKLAAGAGAHYGGLGSEVAMAQAKLLGLYAAVRGGTSVFKNAMESVDYYQKAIIRMSASATDVAPVGTNLEKYYADQKQRYKELIDYIQIASAKYFANAREIMTVTEWAIARGHTNLGKKEVDAIGQMIDKIKQLVPWIKQEGQVLQEINALWEGNTRVTDTFGKLVFDRLKAMKLVTEEGKKAKDQYKDILAGWKDEGFSGFLQKINDLFKGSAIASKDIQMTWESTIETLGTLKDKLLLTAFKPIYEDVNKLLQGIVEKYLTGADAAQKQADIAKEVAAAWRMIKNTAADVAPIIQTITRVMADAWGAVKGMPEGVQEVGIVAFFLVGSKGKAVIVAVLAMMERVETLLQSMKAVITGGMTIGQFFGGDKGELDGVIDKMKEINRQKENFNQFKDMNTGPAKKAPFKLMSYGEEEDYFGAPIESYIQDTDISSVFGDTAAIGGGQGGSLIDQQRRMGEEGKKAAEFWEAAWKRAGENVQDGLSGMFYNIMTQTGTAADMLQNIFQGFARIISEMAAQTIMNLAKIGLNSLMGSSSGSGGFLGGMFGSVGGLFGGLFGGGSSAVGGFTSSVGGVMNLPTLMATGGVLPGGFTPIRAYGDGAIFNSPTLGVIGERGPEAVVPLDQYNQGGGNYQISVAHNPVYNYRPTAEDYKRDAKMIVQSLDKELRNLSRQSARNFVRM